MLLLTKSNRLVKFKYPTLLGDIMKITKMDLENWRKNTLNLARTHMYLDEDILKNLEITPLKIIQKDSGRMFYGYVDLFFDNKSINVYFSNPSKYLPKKLREMWNQSGMDHELIGHLCNYLTNQKYHENSARKTQLEMIKLRASKSLIWKLAEISLNPILKFKDYINKN
jgi:hypothetical protein